jgi:hypothetical protein
MAEIWGGEAAAGIDESLRSAECRIQEAIRFAQRAHGCGFDNSHLQRLIKLRDDIHLEIGRFAADR